MKILLVEDNPADARLFTDFFNDSFNIKIAHVGDGALALDYLYHKGTYLDVSLPDIIVLDLNLPKIGGMHILELIKEDDKLKKIPVIVLGTSNEPKEIKRAYNSHANCYIVKPIDFDHLRDVLKSIEGFWFNIVTLP
jgi:two-component system, chemotaxis family, response regulator Rcp1